MKNEVEYTDNGKYAHIDGYRFTRDKKTGYYLSSRIIGSSRERLHVYVWRKHYGEVPDGFHIHHIDHDKRNNEITNLELISACEHIVHHGEAMTSDHRRKLTENIYNKALPKAIEWHKSNEGREWHKVHGKATWEGREPIEYVCDNCGQPFSSRKAYSSGNKFCSNKCKTSFRRKSGVDDITFTCSECGEAISCNKYTNRKRCLSCGQMNQVPRQ